MKFLVLALLLIASPAWAAIAVIGDTTANTCVDTASGTTLVCTTNATVEAGNVHIVVSASNNAGTTDADHSEITSVVDSASNTYSKLCEFTNGQGGAAAGATVSIWQSRLTAQLTSGGTFTVNYANTITSRAANGYEFTVGAALSQASTCQTAAADGTTDPGSLAFSGLTSVETLWFRGIAQEQDGGGFLTQTVGYGENLQVLADGGSTATSMQLRGELLISTDTAETSAPTLPFGGDSVSVFVALREVSTARPISPIMFQ